MGPHKNLRVWNESMELAKKVYQLTANFPKEELFGLVSQMRRCAVSIPSNIAEGYGRGTNAELIHFLYISLGSSNELDTQLELSRRFAYVNDEDFIMLDALNNSVNKMIQSLIYVRKNQNATSDPTLQKP
ncbi:four helix bundle protein [Marseilla massiliensis]|uniref:Four helix bundle protein n=1 Tax=Marseilla massiliensis TaxID=1841864 RepID=A0A938WUF2_9BACT|nr:four helix bundle protein [Marseilla massiliensis]MBM6674227.1 four helix bundle protein [Marseilla massiliensis]CCY65094.1 uncharacterized protein BN467_01827 [Prevotella sp. CAG:1124]